MRRQGGCSSGVVVRALGVLLLLLSLLGMHGLAHAEISGCHGAGRMVALHTGPMHGPSAPVHVADGHAKPVATAQPGTMCLAVLPTAVVSLVGSAVLGTLILLVAADLLLGSAVAARWRAPPRAGVAVLLRVCVSRT